MSSQKLLGMTSEGGKQRLLIEVDQAATEPGRRVNVSVKWRS